MDMRERYISFRFDTETEMAEFIYAIILTNNSTGKSWAFREGFDSDGHSVGVFKHFDKWVHAAFCHDQDCGLATMSKSYAVRRRGDRDYRDNLTYLGAPKHVVYRRYAAVSAQAFTLKLRGKLK